MTLTNYLSFVVALCICWWPWMTLTNYLSFVVALCISWWPWMTLTNYLSFVVALWRQTAKQQLEQCRHDVSKHLGSVCDDHFPDVQRRLADEQRTVWTTHVEAGQHAVTPVSTEHLENHCLWVLSAKVVILAGTFCWHLTSHSYTHRSTNLTTRPSSRQCIARHRPRLGYQDQDTVLWLCFMWTTALYKFTSSSSSSSSTSRPTAKQNFAWRSNHG